jgi:hypothetical protein
MLVTNFGLKYFLYKAVLGICQLADVEHIHPTRERAIRALDRTVKYIEPETPSARGF